MNRTGIATLLALSVVLAAPPMAASRALGQTKSPADDDKGNDKGSKKRGSKKSGNKKDSKKGSDKGKKRDGKVDMSAIRPDKKAERRALESVGEGFHLDRTRHYSIIYDTSEEDVQTFGGAIEQTYRSCVNYTMKLGFDAHPPKRKLIIYYFEKHDSYSVHSRKLGKGALPQSTPGIYFTDLNLSMFYNFRNQDSFRKAREQAEDRIEQLQQQLLRGGVSPAQRKQIQEEIKKLRAQANRSNTLGGDFSESIVQHEVSHQVLWNIGFHNPDAFLANPRWFVEGTAMMFEPISTGHSANVGALNRQRLEEYRALEEAGKLIPLRELVSTHAYFGPSTINIAYPESWALVHYLNRAKRDEVKKYVAIINARPKDYVTTPEQEVADFEKAFGKPDDRFERRWKRWIKKLR